jgi:uncharacterized protein (DUF2147 family)
MKVIILLIVILVLTSICANAQIIGKWKTVDDEDGVEKSIVEIYEKNGKLQGRVDKLLPAATVTHCAECPGELKNKPLVGMEILVDLTKNETGGEDGEILDPKSGKWYTCYMELVSPDKLKLRGYIGIPTFGRTQYWYRVK